MKRLPAPPFAVKDAVEQCAAGMTLAARIQALLGALPVLQLAEATYRAMAPTGQLYQIPTSDHVTPDLSGELMGTIYKSHFTRTGAPSRALYETIRMAPPYGICPMCAQRIVASVDHYLPQSLHPAFNLTPANLVPACSDCNKNKLAKFAKTAAEQTLHPYFDDLGSDRWLVVDLTETAPPSVVYRVKPAPGWTAVLTARVEHHFDVMGLGELYAAQAASELADISFGLAELAKTGGPVAIRSHLYGEYASRYARDPNSWKTALYEALCASAWFCNQGHALVR